MNFEVIRQTIRRTDSAPIIADSINYLTAKFRFSSDWTGLEKHVTFTLGTNVYDKTLDADDEIKADQGLNLTEGIWTIGIVGVEVVEGEMVERITADTVTVLVTMAGALGGEAFPEMSGAFGEIILQSEADRVAAEAARVAAEEEREAYYAAAQTGFDEEARVTAENLRIEAENAREIAEEARESFYQDAQTGFDESARVSAENLRIEAENARDIAEGLRDSAEHERVSDEGLRITAEQGRDTAEGLRVTAEGERVSAEGLRVTAEESRVSAEGLRVTAEESRVSAEDGRIAAESARAFYAAYSGTTSYVLGNKVSYNGSSYIWNSSTPSTAGTQPPSTGWLLIASRGDDGLNGADGVSGVYVGSDPIPEGYNVQIDPDGDATDVVLQFSTMPTADADYLGVTALFTGTTGTYKNGGTYICVASADPTPVYSWSQIGSDLHAHSNKTALDAVSGTNTGDQDVSGAISAHNTDAAAHAALVAPFRRPLNGLYDGVDLSTVFASAADFRAAVAAGDFSKIRIGDYWPISLTGSFRDVSSYTVPSGITYYTDPALTTPAGTTSTTYEGIYYSATAVRFTISSTTYYAAIGSCLAYFVRTLNNAVLKLEVAAINPYINYGDTAFSVNHVLLISRDCLPVTLKMRAENSIWYNTGATNPWLGSALYETLNNVTYGLLPLIAASNIGSYIYAGPNSNGMRWLGEVKASGVSTPTSWSWVDRGKIFLPTELEIWNQSVYTNHSYCMGLNNQIDIFKGSMRHIVKGLGNGGSRYSWWFASANVGYATGFAIVDHLGIPYSGGASYSFGVPACFLLS